MSKAGDRVKCPKCHREARVVWVSQDRKTVAIRCLGYHSQLSLPPTRLRKNTQTKTKKGMVFLIKATKKG